MALDAENVVVGITGLCSVGPTTATAPTGATAALEGFTDLGYISTDGVTFTTDKATSDIRAWQNGDLVRSVITEGTVTYSFMLLETTKEAIELYFGSAMTAGKISHNPTATGGRKSFVIDVVDGDKKIRHYVPTGEVLSVEAQAITNGDALGFGVTVTAYISAGRAVDIFYSEFVGS
jgi:pectin methylesterase-like acyl-CoA thioesterase